MTLTDTSSELAWAAGLFEGEGHIGLYAYPPSDRRAGLFHRSLVLAMCDEDVVKRFHRTVGVGRLRQVPPPRNKPAWQPSWRWECSRWDEIEPMLRSFLPWLGQRRALRATEMLENPPRFVRGKDGRCVRGHDPEDVYVAPNGKRYCRACQKIHRKKYEPRRRHLNA